MSNSTRSKGKISSVRSEPVRLNTLVSTTKQGNNSMADVQDAEDSNGEAEGSDIITSNLKFLGQNDPKSCLLTFFYPFSTPLR